MSELALVVLCAVRRQRTMRWRYAPHPAGIGLSAFGEPTEVDVERLRVELAPHFSFDQFAPAISEAGLLVSPDTAAVHLAAAFGIGAVCMFVQSDKTLRIWDAYKSPAENLVTDVDDLSTIPVDDVWKAVKRLWEKRT